MEIVSYDKENGYIKYNYGGHDYAVNITYGKIEAYKDNVPMKRLGKIVQYMIKRYNDTF